MPSSLTTMNWLAVVVAAVVALGIGIVWYTPAVFGLRWAGLVKQYTGLTDAQLTPANLPLTLGLWFIGFLVNAFALGVLLHGLGILDLVYAVLFGVLVTVGIGLVISSWPVIHAKQPVGLWVINGAAFLVMQVVMSVILTLWK